MCRKTLKAKLLRANHYLEENHENLKMKIRKEDCKEDEEHCQKRATMA